MSTQTKPNIMLNQPCTVASCCAWFSLRGNYMQACWRVVVVLNNVLQLLSIKCRSYFPAVVLEQTGIYWIHQSLYCGLNSRVSCRAQCFAAWPIKWINPDKTLPLRHQLPNEDRNQIAGQTATTTIHSLFLRKMMIIITSVFKTGGYIWFNLKPTN